MKPNILQQITALRDQLSTAPNSVELAPLSSGIIFLHVHVRERCFVLAYYPREGGFGVDELQDDEGFEMGYKNWFDSLLDAKAHLLQMVNHAKDLG